MCVSIENLNKNLAFAFFFIFRISWTYIVEFLLASISLCILLLGKGDINRKARVCDVYLNVLDKMRSCELIGEMPVNIKTTVPISPPFISCNCFKLGCERWVKSGFLVLLAIKKCLELDQCGYFILVLLLNMPRFAVCRVFLEWFQKPKMLVDLIVSCRQPFKMKGP